eukprot:COSAG01_NODE_3685_length_5797_cov_4.035802_10_plen_58_part_00
MVTTIHGVEGLVPADSQSCAERSSLALQLFIRRGMRIACVRARVQAEVRGLAADKLK